MFICKECGKEFDKLRSLHTHLKGHDMYLADYYVKHYQRRNKLTGELLQFKNYKDYFSKDFSFRSELMQWCKEAPKQEVEEYILKMLRDRIEDKKMTHAPSTVELYAGKMPSIDVYKDLFGSYTKAAELCGVKPRLGKPLTDEFLKDFSNTPILIDTREKLPLQFKSSSLLKLDVGDYAVTGDLYAYTYVDRKSFSDFCSTMSQAYKRFARELTRCREIGAFLYVVVDEGLYCLHKVNSMSRQKHNMDYVMHNMKELQASFADCCQFVFSGSRENSQKLIPKLLVLGDKCWGTDIQYYIDNKILDK